MQSQLIIHGTQGRAARRSVRDVPRQARVDAAAEGGRAPRQRVHRFDPAADRRADRRVEVRAQGGPGVPGPARPRRRLLPPARRGRAAAGLRRGRRAGRALGREGRARGRRRPRGAARAVPRCRSKVPFLVTGASGSLGTAVVQAAARRGPPRARVRSAASRRRPRTASSTRSATSAIRPPSTARSQGAEIVIHCGAAMKGGWPEHKGGTVVGTQNVIDACKKHGVKQLVHISSMSVIDWAGIGGQRPGHRGRARSSRAPDERGAYTRAKLEAEQLGRRGGDARACPCVILRPGQIFGGGIPLINGAVARNAGGRWLVLGDGKLELPLVYIDDVVDAIMAAVDKQLDRRRGHPDHRSRAPDPGGRARPRRRRASRSCACRARSCSRSASSASIPLGALGRPSPIARLPPASPRSRACTTRATAPRRCSAGSRASASARASGA